MVGDSRSEPIELPFKENALFTPNEFKVTHRWFGQNADQAPFFLIDHLCGLIKALVRDIGAKRLRPHPETSAQTDGVFGCMM